VKKFILEETQGREVFQIILRKRKFLEGFDKGGQTGKYGIATIEWMFTKEIIEDHRHCHLTLPVALGHCQFIEIRKEGVLINTIHIIPFDGEILDIV